MKQLHITFLFTMLMSIVGAKSYAQSEPFEVDGIYYRYSVHQDDYSVDVVHPNATAVSEDDAMISIPSSYSGDITIPSEISRTVVVTDTYEWGDEYTHEETYNYRVENIGSGAFYGSEITSIVIPNSVTNILSGAFARCTKLSSIIIPKSVYCINGGAFYGCSGLKSLDIPQCDIGESAFAECDNLTSVTVRMEVPVSIDESVFSNRTNATLYVPAGCKEAYMTAPYWQDFKEIVEMSPIITFADYYVKDICVSKWDTDGDGELSEDEAAAVTSLGFAFKDNRNIKNFDELRFFTGLTSIRDEEFYYCTKLTSIIIPDNVTSIGRCAFFDCESLKSLKIPSSVNNIGNAAFLDCGLGLTSITVESGNTQYDSRNNCNAIIETKTNKLLWGCNNTIIPNSVTSIDNSAFSHCMLMNTIDIPEGVTNIGSYAFYNCEKLTSVVVPDLVTAIGEAAFWHCDDLLSVVIGEKVENIGNMAFHSCDNLTSITVKRAAPISITENVFTNRANATLYVPYGSKAAYEKAIIWKEFKEIVEMAPFSPNIVFADANVKALCVANWDTNEDGELSEAEAAAVTSLENVFTNNIDIISFEELQFFTGLTSIGDKAFYECSKLRSVIIPSGVTSIGLLAFFNCSLTSVTIPSGVLRIGNEAFSKCSSLTSVIIPEGVTIMGQAAFQNCSSLISVIIPSSMMMIGYAAFLNTGIYNNSPTGVFYVDNWVCGYKGTIPSNTSITFKDGTVGIADWAFDNTFDNLNGLTSVTIPSGVTNIGYCAFWKCSGLASVVFPPSVTSIVDKAFEGCSSLTSVIAMMETPININYNVFSNRANATLYVPYGSKTDYETADVWKQFKEIIEMPAPVTPSRLYAEETSVRCGSQTVIPVLFENVAEYGGLQFEVTLPEGITLNKVTKTERLSDDFVLQKSQTGDNTWQILLYNSNRLSFTGNDGALFTMTVDVADEMAEGDYTMTFSDIVASGVDESQEDLADFSTTITVEKYLTGDANRDNRVNVTDIMAVANYILKQPSNNFNVKAADVNNDNRVNVTDIMGIANIILKVNPTKNTPAKKQMLDPQ